MDLIGIFLYHGLEPLCRRLSKIIFLSTDMVYNGVADSLLSEDSGMGMILETMKTVSSKLLYNRANAENIELTAMLVISGILEKYSLLLKLPFDVFEALIDDPSQLKNNDCLKEKYKMPKIINIDMATFDLFYHRMATVMFNALPQRTRCESFNY